MSDVERLLAEATPLPWYQTEEFIPADAALIVYATNALPLYEEMREAAVLLAESVRRYFDDGQAKAVVNLQPLTERIERIARKLDE